MVTVFTDRAELKRVFTVELHPGFNNVVINNVCSSIEPDSIRVEGKGKATIHEVQYKVDHATDSETDTPQVRKLVEELEELELKKATINDLLKVYQNRLASLDDVVKNLGKVTLARKDTPELLRFDAGVEETLENFYGYHERKAVELNTKVRKSELEVRTLDEELIKLRNQISTLRFHNNVKRSICVSLESTEVSQAEIELTYQVNNAWWTPFYDIRVLTTESKPKLKLNYYANIGQNSGEDWSEVNLILSTAQPRSGAALPPIGTLQAQLFKPPPPPTFAAPPRAMMKTARTSLFGSAAASNAQFDMDEAQPEIAYCMAAPQYKAEHHALSTTFAVKQKKTIPSDGSDHKVTIVSLDLEPVLHFDCVPSKSTNVYLTASMLNSSSYPLLSGTASVYTSVTMNEQKIVVKNTKQDEPIVLTMITHVPKSTDEKIKVKLYAPELKLAAPPTANSNQPAAATNDESRLKAPEVGTRLTDAHNLEWTVVLNPSEEREFVVKFGVECPPTESVEFVERF
ncbi:Protein F37C4.5 [Aphelenchoides fujianensis]|nr:Protein F37C4.5 [Aphelenchoides fujianensis]